MPKLRVFSLQLSVVMCFNAIFFCLDRIVKRHVDELELKVELLKIINHRFVFNRSFSN